MSRRKLQLSDNATSQSSTSDVSPSILITVLILAIAVILFASLYLLLRFLRRNRHTTITTATSAVTPPSLRQVSPVIDSLPVFTYDRLTAKETGDCAVCLSRFEKNDLLRLLPVCCHAFHVECIDTWLHANMTCPLCRSAIYLPENELFGKITEHSRSFRVEIGNVSNRHNDVTNSGEIRRSYSISGAFDYVISAEETAIDDVTSSSFRRTISSEMSKEVDTLAAEVGIRGGGGGGWLKDYLSCSLSCSFRSSGRFFTGSSRRSTVELPVGNRENELVELEEASRLGSEIGELFRWLSGV